MNFKKTKLKGNYLIDLKKNKDERGFFSRYFCKKEFSSLNLNTKWVQINNSFTKKARTLRGLHFQTSKFSEVKLIRCIKGTIWDVVVDLRKESKTFGKWFGTILSEENRTMMYVPKNFAHGFISLSPNTELIYLVSNYYVPESEKTLVWNDKDIAIKWPINPKIISKKDRNGLLFKSI